jgi:hypothetical protein
MCLRLYVPGHLLLCLVPYFRHSDELRHAEVEVEFLIVYKESVLYLDEVFDNEVPCADLQLPSPEWYILTSPALGY